MTSNTAIRTASTRRPNKIYSVVGGNDKAAKITQSKPVTLSERWGEALTIYGDYFIRY